MAWRTSNDYGYAPANRLAWGKNWGQLRHRISEYQHEFQVRLIEIPSAIRPAYPVKSA